MMVGSEIALGWFWNCSSEITEVGNGSFVAVATRWRIDKSPNRTGVHSRAICESARRWRQTSGPTPAGSPMVIAMRGRFICS